MTQARQGSQETRIALAATMGALALFAAASVMLSLRLRGELRHQALQREADTLAAVVEMNLENDAADPGLGLLRGTKEAAFGAVLASTHLKGVLATRLFDERGELWTALPATAADARATPGLVDDAALRLIAGARYHPNASLADSLGSAGLGAMSARAPLLEVALPITATEGGGGRLSVAHYWIDGAPLQRDFAAMDRGLLIQAGVVFLVGSAGLSLILAWAFRRLARTGEELRRRSEDLARANSELVFSAKNAALGAISANLLHGIRNPLMGLEGYLSDARDSAETEPQSGPALQEAVDTTRRLGRMVRDLSALLREEASLGDGLEVSSAELFEALRPRIQPKADKVGVRLSCEPGSVRISSRAAHLALPILENLATNAIEVSAPTSTVEIRCGAEDAGAVWVEVRDQGRGIPKHVQDTLFRPSATTKAGGSGLGLAISWHLARHAGGSLELVQTGNRGTVLRLRLPGPDTSTPVA